VQLRGLAERLETDRPVYAIQARGADPRHSPHTTIAEMAEAYVSVIRAVQPRGPYALGGYSFGGLIAFEMACRMQELGEQVDVLALFETDVHHRNLQLAEWLSHQLDLFGRVVRKLKILPPAEWLSYLGEKLTMIWNVFFNRRALPKPEDHSIKVPEAMVARNRELYRICFREFVAYRPRRFAGRVAAFRTAHPPFYMCDPLPLWNRLTDGVDVFTVAGTHGTIMEDRHVVSVASQLSRYLARGGSNESEWPDEAQTVNVSPLREPPQTATT